MCRAALLGVALSCLGAIPLSAQTMLPGPIDQSPPFAALAVQVCLDRLGFSPGEIDGTPGRNTNGALAAFRQAKHLPPGPADAAMIETLSADAPGPALVPYSITAEDVAGPLVPEIPGDLMAQAALPALGYTSMLEMLGERFHASPALLRKLNPGASFASAGEVIQVPNVGAPPVVSAIAGAVQAIPSAVITVSKGAGALTVFDSSGTLVFYAPVTVGSEHDPLPIGEWAVTSVTYDPIFNYNPDLFWDADPGHAKAQIQAGPNNPVGSVWIALTRDHYGIHGTPEPGRIGHTESHGCVRLTNWDALRVAAFAAQGTRVLFTE